MDNAGANNTKNNARSIGLGLRQNINQFSILVLVNAFVGAMIGLEQTVVPLIGRDEFGIESNALIVSFIASFGAVKAVLNLFAVGFVTGYLAATYGLKPYPFHLGIAFVLLGLSLSSQQQYHDVFFRL